VAGVTTWTARRVGDRIMCGRLVAGNPRCGGELCVVVPGVSTPKLFELPGGLVAVFDEEVPHWRRSARWRTGSRRPAGSQAYGPFTRDCPRCGERNLVEQRLL
jgi:hypothetical protein